MPRKITRLYVPFTYVHNNLRYSFVTLIAALSNENNDEETSAVVNALNAK